MKKLVTALALLVSATALAQPDKDWWACQRVKAAGLAWEGGKWNASAFGLDPPFVLVSDGNGGLTQESVANALAGGKWSSLASCMSRDPYITCEMAGLRFLLFDPSLGLGGTVDLAGTAQSKLPQRDTPVLDAFECTKG